METTTNQPRPSTPPPAHNLTVLSADLLAVAAKRIVEQLASPNWEPLQQLKDALSTYESVRLGQTLRNADPQAMQVTTTYRHQSPKGRCTVADLQGMPLPAMCQAVGLLCTNAANQLAALSQAHSRVDLLCEVPRLTTTARNAAKLARDSLECLLEQLGDKPPKRKGRK